MLGFATTGRWELSKMRALHHEIARLHVAGLSNQEIAEELGCSTPTVSGTLRSAITTEHIRSLQNRRDDIVLDGIGEDIKHAAKHAATFLRDVTTGQIPSPINTRTRVAMDALNRAGYAPVVKTEQLNLTGTLTSSDIQDIIRIAKGSPEVVPDDEVFVRDSRDARAS